MIQDATGKFSSRSPLPDRNSLAEVIGGWLTIVGTGRSFTHTGLHAGGCRRGPHIGEYGRKTNPVWRWLPCRIRPETGRKSAFVGQRPSLLVVGLQDLVA